MTDKSPQISKYIWLRMVAIGLAVLSIGLAIAFIGYVLYSAR